MSNGVLCLLAASLNVTLSFLFVAAVEHLYGFAANHILPLSSLHSYYCNSVHGTICREIRIMRELKNMWDWASCTRNAPPENLILDLTRALCIRDPSPDVVWWVCTSSALHPCSPFLRAPLCLLLAGSRDREGSSASGKRRLNMVWWGMWENSRVHLYIQQPACQPSSRPSRPLSAWTRGAFVPHLLATPCPAPAPPSYPSLHPVAPPLPPSFHSPQNSTAGPLWK